MNHVDEHPDLSGEHPDTITTVTKTQRRHREHPDDWEEQEAARTVGGLSRGRQLHQEFEAAGEGSQEWRGE